MRFETSGQGSKNRIFTPFGDLYIDVENLFDQVMGNMPSAKGSSGEPVCYTHLTLPTIYSV